MRTARRFKIAEDDNECVGGRMGRARAAKLARRMRINVVFLMTNSENDIAHGKGGLHMQP